MARFASISTRKLSNALKILTADKCMVATSDYNEFHKMVKKHILANVLGANAQVGLLVSYNNLFHAMVWLQSIPD